MTLNLERGLGVTVEGFLQLIFSIQQQYANKPNKMLISIRGVMRGKKDTLLFSMCTT